VSGAVILLGILLTEQLTHVRNRTDEVRASTHLVVMQLPIAIAYMSTTPPSDRRVEFGSDGYLVYQSVTSALVEIDVATRHRGVRSRRKIRQAQEDLSARLSAAYFRCVSRRQYLTNEERYNFPTDVLHSAVFGSRKDFDDKFKQYLADGFS